MSTLVTRAGKGSPLTHNEVDANFTNLNTDKIQSGNTVAALTITAITTPSVQASGSGGLALKNSAGTTQISMGAGGGDNVTVAAPIAITPANGLVNIAPTGTGSLTINPATAGTMNNMAIGGTTAAAGSFTDLSVTGTTSFDGAQGTAGQVLTSAGAGNTPTWATVSGSISVTGGDLTLSGNTGTAITNATLATVNSNTGSFGSSSSIPVVTVNAKGLVTAVSTVSTSSSVPTFSAYANATQSLSNNSLTKLVLGAEEFDTANAFDSTTNYRFTPQVAGYYQINAVATLQGGAGTGQYQVLLVKNGSSVYKRTSYFGTVDLSPAATNIFYLNGSTDYIEVYVYQNSGITKTIFGASDTGYTYMTGCLLRTA
jgi:hypothetical protein